MTTRIPENSIVRNGLFFTRGNGGVSGIFPLAPPGDTPNTRLADQAVEALKGFGVPMPDHPATVQQYTRGKVVQIDWNEASAIPLKQLLKASNINLYRSPNAAFAAVEAKFRFGDIKIS